MRYLVRAQPRTGSIPKLWSILNDGTVEIQRPDGQEIIASMKRAVFKDGVAEWSETCYCDPPLQHEKSTVYDRFFKDIQIVPLEEPVQLNGEPFWEYLRDHSTQEKPTVQTNANLGVRYAPIRIL